MASGRKSRLPMIEGVELTPEEIANINDFARSQTSTESTQRKFFSQVQNGLRFFKANGVKQPTGKDYAALENALIRYNAEFKVLASTRRYFEWEVQNKESDNNMNVAKTTQPQPADPITKSNAVKKVNFNLDRNDYMKLSVLALKQDTSLSDLLTQAVKDFLAKHTETLQKITGLY